MERTQTLGRGPAVFKQRCCRVSYGVLCLEEYNPSKPAHIGQKVTLDPRDGKKWVEDQIDWFVKQVSIVSVILCPRYANRAITSRERMSLLMAS